MTMPKINLAELVSTSRELEQRARQALEASENAQVRALAADVAAPVDAEEFTLALVGAYDAGKSTIVSALTGRDDVVIGADVSTDRVTAYSWRGIRLLDTPGIHAGRPDHDAVSHGAIDHADLLLYVVSNELFDDQLAARFRSIVFDRARAPQTMLVVNKMTQDSGGPAEKLPDLARVTHPLSPADLHVVFIDARAALDSVDAATEDKDDLLALANWSAFTDQINDFVRTNGHLARAAQPLHTLMATLAKAENLLAAAEDSNEGMQLELLRRKRGIIVASERRLRADLRALVEQANGDVVTIGDRLAEALDPAAEEEVVKSAADDAAAGASKRVEKLVADAAATIEAGFVSLQAELDALAGSALARRLEERIRVASDFNVNPELTAPSVAYSAGQRGAGVVEAQASWLADLAKGPSNLTAATAKAASGSKLHEGVYAVGKYFGYKFKPWEAVNIAKNIGNVARVVGVAAGMLGPVFQVMDERHQDRVTRDLQKARSEIRAAFLQSASDVAGQMNRRAEEILAETHGVLTRDVDRERERIVSSQQTRSLDLRQIGAITAEVRATIARFQPPILE